MSAIEKAYYGLFLTMALALGGLVYQNALHRIALLEAAAIEMAKEVKAKAIIDAATLAEIRLDANYLRRAVDRIEVKLETVSQPIYRPKINVIPPKD